MIAVKNHSKTTHLNAGAIKDEIAKAELMVKPGCPAFLFIAATQYSRSIQSRFPRNKDFFVMHNVPLVNLKEVIVLDLTTPENRAEFFGCQNNELMKSGLETIIEKTVQII